MGGFPALMIKPPESPISELGGVLALKGAVQQQAIGAQQEQLNDVKLVEAKRESLSRQTLMDIYAKNGGDMNQTLADAIHSGKVTPEDVNTFRQQSVAAQISVANLDEKRLANLSKYHDLAANELEAWKNLPLEQRTPDWLKGAAARLANENVDISKVMPQLQSLAQDPSDANTRSVLTQFKGEQWLLANDKAERDAAQAPSTPEVIAKRNAEQAKLIADTNKSIADTSEALEKTRQMGKVTDLEVYKQQQENYRASLSRQATFANQLQKNGLEQLDKMFADPQHGYTNFLAQAQSTKNTIMQSKSGSELASSLEPLMMALGVTSFAGVHRINQTEVNAAGPHAGSLYRQLDSLISKAGSGSIPDDTLKEATAIVDGLIDAKHESMLNAANMVVGNAGLDPAKTLVMDRSGVISPLKDAAKGHVKEIATTGHNVGDVVTVKGKQVKITKIYPDGSFDGE